MIQLIVYTGFYWPVKVMESPHSAARALPPLASPSSPLNQHFFAELQSRGESGRAGFHRLLMLTIYGCDEFPAR